MVPLSHICIYLSSLQLSFCVKEVGMNLYSCIKLPQWTFFWLANNTCTNRFWTPILLSAHSYGKRECQLSQRLRAYWLHSAPCHCIFSWVQVALHIYYLEHELVVLAVFEISVSKWYWSLNSIILWKVIQNKYDGISLKLLLIAFDKYDGNFWTHAHVSI